MERETKTEKVEQNETFRYLHKIMLLGDTLEFEQASKRNENREIDGEKVVAKGGNRFTTSFMYSLSIPLEN